MRSAFRPVSLTASLLVGLAVTAPAQTSTLKGSIRGIIHDSLITGRPLAGATVDLLELNRVQTADERGVFRFDSLPGGRFTLSFTHPSLAEIGFTPPDKTVDLAPGIDVAVVLATPAAGTIYRRLCPGPREPNTGVVLGTLVDAGSGRPIPGAGLRGEWTESSLSRTTAFVRRQRVIRAAADSTGRYRLCGVPTDVAVLLRTVVQGRDGAPLELKLEGRVLGVRHFSAPSDSSSHGPGMLTGRVTGNGIGVAEAQVRVIGTDRVVRTGPDGAFSIADLPLGSHTVEARALGYSRRLNYVDLRPNSPVHLTFELSRVPVELPELRVTASASAAARSGFEERRRLKAGGYFITAEDIARRGAIRVENLFNGVPGMQVISAGLADYRILSTRGGSGFNTECEPTVYVDEVRIPLDPENGLGLPVLPSEVEGIEIHPGPGTAPLQYRAVGENCGVILIWTKRGRR